MTSTPPSFSFTQNSPFHPHHHQPGTPLPLNTFLFDSSSPFYTECSSSASSPMAASSPASSSSSAGRNRISMACNYCRHRKIKCDGSNNCKTCIRTKRVCSYEEVSDDVNRATKERKAYLKALKIQGLSTGARTPRSRRGTGPCVSLSVAPVAPSSSTTHQQLDPSPFIDGWAPTPSSPSPVTPFARPFPSVLQGTPLHAAFFANLIRSEKNGPTSPAEEHTYSQMRKTSRASQTPPRSRSPSPQSFHSVSNCSTPAAGGPPGFTSFFPHHANTEPSAQWSPSGSVSSFASTSAPYTPTFAPTSHLPYAPPAQYTYNANKSFSPASPPDSPEEGTFTTTAPASFCHHPSFTNTVNLDDNQASGSSSFFYLPPSPVMKPRSTFASMQQPIYEGSGRNPGLGLDLPVGFAPGLPMGGAGNYEAEMKTERQWAGEGMIVEEQPEVIVFQGWGQP